MLAEVSWIFAVPASIFATICLACSLLMCVCGCRTKEHKDELAGIEGRVKITNPEDYPQEIEVNANNISAEVALDKSQSTAKRSLPDLPVDSNVGTKGDVTWEPNGDATSELYATVVLQDEKNRQHNRQKSESDSMSPSVTYTKVKEDHPYDKLKKVEHPYAQVKDHGSSESTKSTSHSNNINKEDMHREQQDEVEIVASSRNDTESTVNIPAANAIAGHVTASEDLPYMTPPAHFSGDSQDSGTTASVAASPVTGDPHGAVAKSSPVTGDPHASQRVKHVCQSSEMLSLDKSDHKRKFSEGYTSISVREPLSAIRAESKVTTSRKADPHYATVSDDSDDMYAAIDDPSQVYTSESETYAQIHPGSNRPKSAPQPPSVDSLKQMTISSHSHSRQASSSSLGSSTVISSPKHEKRPANSPLPPTPTQSPDSTEDLYSTADKSFRQQGSPRNLEDMYAKVNKKGRREFDHFERGGSTESGASESSDSMSYKLHSTTTTETSRSCHSYLSKSTFTDSPASSSNKREATEFSFSSESDQQSGYEKLGESSFEIDGKSDPGYETVHKGSPLESDPEYEKLKPQKHSYANVEATNVQIDCYANESDVGDGYARVKADSRKNEIYSKIDACESDGYARVEPQEAVNDDGYAKVLKHNNNKTEPNYERVLIPKPEDPKHSEPFSEPTYESLGNEFDDPNDPNYESVRFLQSSAHIEPPYQLLRECESGTAEQ